MLFTASESLSELQFKKSGCDVQILLVTHISFPVQNDSGRKWDKNVNM